MEPPVQICVARICLVASKPACCVRRDGGCLVRHRGLSRDHVVGHSALRRGGRPAAKRICAASACCRVVDLGPAAGRGVRRRARQRQARPYGRRSERVHRGTSARCLGRHHPLDGMHRPFAGAPVRGGTGCLGGHLVRRRLGIVRRPRPALVFADAGVQIGHAAAGSGARPSARRQPRKRPSSLDAPASIGRRADIWPRWAARARLRTARRAGHGNEPGRLRRRAVRARGSTAGAGCRRGRGGAGGRLIRCWTVAPAGARRATVVERTQRSPPGAR
jgi:hypothetical protein